MGLLPKKGGNQKIESYILKRVVFENRVGSHL